MGEASFLTLLEGAYLSIIGVSEGSPRSFADGIMSGGLSADGESACQAVGINIPLCQVTLVQIEHQTEITTG